MNYTLDERMQLARNISTPVDTLKQLATDEESIVRQYVANNPSTPGGVLKQLADKGGWTRYWVALNPSTPVDCLKQLAVCNDPSIRWCVALNPSTPGDVLAQLAEDKCREVSERAQETMEEKKKS